MKLSISQIYKRGDPAEERLVLKVLNDTNLGFYVVILTEYTASQNIKAAGRYAYWFEPKPVKAGDSVILFSKIGTPSQRQLEDGSTAHFLYWNANVVLWGATGKCAVLMELQTWVTSPYE